MLIGAVAPWLARRIWKRRPAAEPGAPPRAQLEVLTDRIGTGLLLATVVGVIAAGLAARPLVVVETKARERAAKALSALRARPGRRRAAAATSRRPTRDDSPTATSAPASRTTTAMRWTCFFVDVRRSRATVIKDPSVIPNPPR